MNKLPENWKTKKNAILSISSMNSQHIKNAIDCLFRVWARLDDELTEFALLDLDEERSKEYYYLAQQTEFHKSRIKRIEKYMKALEQELKTRPEEE